LREVKKEMREGGASHVDCWEQSTQDYLKAPEKRGGEKTAWGGKKGGFDKI